MLKLVIEKLDKMDHKLDKLDNRVDNVDVTLAKQEVSLSEHIRRTALLEEDVRPIKKHVNNVQGALKLLGLISLLAGIAAVLKELGLI